jgi:hypothetical protein
MPENARKNRACDTYCDFLRVSACPIMPDTGIWDRACVCYSLVMTKTRPAIADLSPLELKRKISVADAAELNAMHPATFRRHHGHLIRRVGKRRQAVELGDAIALPVKGTDAASR